MIARATRFTLKFIGLIALGTTVVIGTLFLLLAGIASLF